MSTIYSSYTKLFGKGSKALLVIIVMLCCMLIGDPYQLYQCLLINNSIPTSIQELITIYKNHNEKWRAMSTTKVVQALRKHPTEIKTYEVMILNTL